MSDATQLTELQGVRSTVIASALVAMCASGTHCAAATGSGSTAFARLSTEAQELIVSAIVGEYDESGPPEPPPEVADEIRMWAETDESSNIAYQPTPGEKQ